jgi:hypothetical protein
VTQRVIGLRPMRYVKVLVPAVVCGAAMFALLWAFSRYVATASLGSRALKLGVGAVAGPSAYLVLLYFGFGGSWRTAMDVFRKLVRGGKSSDEG